METEEKEVNLGILWTVLKKTYIWILLAAIAVGAIAGVGTKLISKETYTAKSTFLISSNTQTTANIAPDMVYVAGTVNATRYILQKAGIEYKDENELKKINELVSVSRKGTNALFDVSVTAHDKENTVPQLAQAYEAYLPDYIAGTAYAGRNIFLRVVNRGSESIEANKVPVARNAVVGAAAGAVAVYLIFLFIKLADKKVYSAEELKKAFAKVPVLGEIPADPVRADEAYRSLRTNVSFTLITSKRKSVFGITGTKENEGKSTVAANLAKAYAGLGKKVLLLEGDLRAPACAAIFGLSTDKGLADCLAERSEDPTPYIVAGVAENLDILPAGHTVSNPSEMLASPEMQKLVKKLRESYDLILVDLPAMGAVCDAGVLCPCIDNYLFVVRQAYSDTRAIAAALDEAQRLTMQIGGFVFNDKRK